MIEKIVMPVTLWKKIVFCTMMVVNNDSAYNAILARKWIHQMDDVMSSLHQMVKFLKDVIEIVKGDQKTARTC